MSVVNAQIVTDQPNSLTDLEKVFSQVVSVAIPLAGIVLFLWLLYGGFQYASAGDDPKKVEGARMTLTYAIVGIVVLASAFLVIQLISFFTGVNSLTNFNIKVN